MDIVVVFSCLAIVIGIYALAILGVGKGIVRIWKYLNQKVRGEK